MKEALVPTPVSVWFTITPFKTACSGSVRETFGLRDLRVCRVDHRPVRIDFSGGRPAIGAIIEEFRYSAVRARICGSRIVRAAEWSKC